MVVNDAAKQTNIKYTNRNVGQFFVHTQTFAASNAYTLFYLLKDKDVSILYIEYTVIRVHTYNLS